ncbi:MAG: 23S rRNA (adenine(1618)-N(6))-methyltransferase RlmF [Saprospiraceae bacterium]|nr:23S rRNA (adenine(1618)-N(6))-methyltransferase RlmF [Saprospiraceae bacterium]MDB4769030.1 23S rRNA (adenine(1618)-N(6))-methyltransferase RlmF [Saprospiraceae bacterium]MDG1432763.1 23S rRNA (adenine(1618)-N(6))-methyltransferase RlmF [Saprospiraceae bacterium]MDG2419175.1 23S rRNA (adenine(1618)-N(6))-methyltransferase RlmF [Saprospiraceae bacterium]
MAQKKKVQSKTKSKLHPQNPHRKRYNFKKLIESCKELAPFVIKNDFGQESINFFEPEAVKMLNTALLKHFYGIDFWEIPPHYLCPPIPGRADYIHHIADLLSASNNGRIPTGEQVNCIDIGVGANCVYPIIGNKTYGWKFIGSDIDPKSAKVANKIIDSNPSLKDKIEIRFQKRKKNIFRGIIKKGEQFDLTICNPPFHASAEEAARGTKRKLLNISEKKPSKTVLNFGGTNNELWTKGGEKLFIKNMIQESKEFAKSVKWFSSLVSKKSNLNAIYDALREAKVKEVKTIPMGQGQKISRIVAWTFTQQTNSYPISNSKRKRKSKSLIDE